MADEGREIVLKLTIDNKEYEARIDVSRKEIIELAKTVGVTEKQLVKSLDEMQKGMNETAASTQKVKENVEKIKPALEQTGAEGKQFGYNLGQDFDGINVTAQDLVERLDDLKERFKNATIGGEEYNHLAGEIQNVSNHLQRVKGDLIQVNAVTNINRAQTGAMRVGVTGVTRALMELDPRLGAITQGFNPFINGFSVASVRGEGFKNTLKAITDQLAGPLGFGLAIGGASILLKEMPGLLNNLNEEAQKAADEGLKDFERQLSKIGSHNIDQKIRDIKTEIMALEALVSIESETGGAGLGLLKLLGVQTETTINLDTAQKKLEKLTEVEKEINEEKKTRIGVLNLEIDSLDKQIKAVENIEGADAKILELNDKKAVVQKELNKLLETTEDRTKRIQQENDKVFDQKRKELEIAQKHAETMLSIQTGNNYLVEQLQAVHLSKMIELHEKYGKDVTEMRLELNNKITEIDAKAEVERRSLLEALTGEKIIDDEILEDVIYGNLIDYARLSAQQELDIWYDKEIEKVSAYENSQEIMFAISEEYDRRKRDLEVQAAMNQLTVYQATLGSMAKLFSKNTAAYKLLSMSMVGIETAKQMMAALSPPPVGLGPLTGKALWPFLIANAGVQMASIAGVNTEIPAYFRGGILEPGKAGFIEGVHKEIIAPEKDFISVVNDLVARSQIAIAGGSYAGGSVGGGNSFIGKIDELNRNIEKLSERPIYITEEAVNKIYEEGDYNARKAIV